MKQQKQQQQQTSNTVGIRGTLQEQNRKTQIQSIVACHDIAHESSFLAAPRLYTPSAHLREIYGHLFLSNTTHASRGSVSNDRFFVIILVGQANGRYL